MNLETEIFLIVGTDTGVGKTVFSGLFTQYLMDCGVGVRAVKPFCAGGKADIEFLRVAQCGNLGQEDLNFWCSDEPISPAAWELRHGQAVDFEGAVDWISRAKWGWQTTGQRVTAARRGGEEEFAEFCNWENYLQGFGSFKREYRERAGLSAGT